MEEKIFIRRGVIENYSARRESANFFFTSGDKNFIGLTAIAAAAVGQTGPAMGLAVSTSEMEEDADYVQFDLGGDRIKGWLWQSPFKEGDEVEVALEDKSGELSCIAVARPKDRIVALYPHLSRGRWAHIRNVAKWWFLGTSGASVFGVLFLIAGTLAVGGKEFVANSDFWRISGIVVLILYGFFGLFSINMAWRFMVFVRAAEKSFSALGWKDVGNIDLNKISRATSTGRDPQGYGITYFRY